MVKAAITAGLLSLPPGKNKVDRLKAQRTPLHPTGLTRSPSRVNRAVRAHSLREAGRDIEATDSEVLHRSTDMRRRDKTLPLLSRGPAPSTSRVTRRRTMTTRRRCVRTHARALSRHRARALSRCRNRGPCHEPAPPLDLSALIKCVCLNIWTVYLLISCLDHLRC
jgi:hypothetical protein